MRLCDLEWQTFWRNVDNNPTAYTVVLVYIFDENTLSARIFDFGPESTRHFPNIFYIFGHVVNILLENNMKL